jgi:GT2 family glycosyltransferase
MNRVKSLRGHRPGPGPFPIRACSFVSCLVRGTVVDAVGLPVAAYRLWLDDVEYTHRLARHHPGICVPSSLAVHATAAAASVFQAPPDRLRLMVRNWIWMLRWSPGLSVGERWLSCLRFLYTVLRTAVVGSVSTTAHAFVSGCRDGIGGRHHG